MPDNGVDDVPRGDHPSTVSSVSTITPPAQAHVAPVSSLKYDLEKSSLNTSTAASSISDGKSVLDTEKGIISWEGYQDDELPAKTQAHWLRNLRFQVFSLYRRLFGIVFVTNMAVFIATCVKGGAEGADAQFLGKVAVANIFVAILMRQDYVINAFFTVACAAPQSWPLWIRRILGRVYTIGGIHSGCGVSGTVWIILFAAQSTRQFLRNDHITIPTLVFTYIIITLLLGMLTFAHPKMRVKRHDTFEMTHRFLGWTAIALVWCLIIFLIKDYQEPGQTLGQAVVRAPPFWLVLIMTFSIILPWLRLRKVPVRPEILSDHCVRLHFDYVDTHPGHFTRMSLSPLTEWHSFATISVPGEKGYSAVVSRAGDWTSETISNPPKELWVRGVPCYGVVRVTPLFRRVLLVATGSGIGPIAPVVFAQKTKLQLLWTAPAVRKTFGDKLVDSLLAANPSAVIYDTREHGKPDMVKLVHRMVREFDAEAVVIISNEPLTRKVVYGMMSRGIPAFGAIWDS
ncbi:uncharacterized protein TRAVEDRAFT_166830 [Trametes versicolor FP-101664 SS1]|uniref:uncharacterized protein n=1 Tax=Trametes versicolor (strain FP-101664) TaxID=717944 RepID=UPI0004623DF1|nr:uncharacterized protein TRAVEDRAFT_166830 [Trametes versicolor FP-101664 SS1]EIW59445.1 hypothetical protein TRAVEDRAFT_166830 [Trametes versicolor FP-101664 SS1]